MDAITIDGSAGEGGGQVLRTSLALSIRTGRMFRLTNIRAGRPNPGLAAQHVTAVRAAAEVTGGRVEGAHCGSREIAFEPGPPRAGDYELRIGTAGSTVLVLQTIFDALSCAGEPSTVAVVGGTHVAWSPSVDYAEHVWLEMMRMMGYRASFTYTRPGFYPKGNGRIEVVIEPHGHLTPMVLAGRGDLIDITGVSVVGSLTDRIAHRQKGRALTQLHMAGLEADISVIAGKSRSPGSSLFLRARYERGMAGFGSLGARGKPAERVADEAVEALVEHEASGAPVDEHLADQLLLPMLFANGKSEIHHLPVTQHLATNARVAERFLPGRVELVGAAGEAGTLTVNGLGAFS